MKMLAACQASAVPFGHAARRMLSRSSDARAGAVAYFRWTVWGRAFVLAAFIGLVLAGVAPPILILFGAVDAAGGLWTARALRRGERHG